MSVRAAPPELPQQPQRSHLQGYEHVSASNRLQRLEKLNAGSATTQLKAVDSRHKVPLCLHSYSSTQLEEASLPPVRV